MNDKKWGSGMKVKEIYRDLLIAQSHDREMYWHSNEEEIEECMTRILHNLLDESTRYLTIEQIYKFPRNGDGYLLVIEDALLLTKEKIFAVVYKNICNEELSESELEFRLHSLELRGWIKMYREQNKFPSYGIGGDKNGENYNP